MPTPLQLAGMRGRYRARLPRTCTLPGAPRTTTVSDATSGVGGTVTEAYGTPVTGVRCSFHAQGGGPAEVEGSVTQIITHEMRFEFGVTLLPGMEVTVDADPATGDGTHRFILIAPFVHPFMKGHRWTAKEM